MPEEVRHHRHPYLNVERSFQPFDYLERPLGGRPIDDRYQGGHAGGWHNGERYPGERHPNERFHEANYYGERHPMDRYGGGQRTNPGGQYPGPPRPLGPHPGPHHPDDRRAIGSREMDIRRRYEGHPGDRYQSEMERRPDRSHPGDNNMHRRGEPYPDWNNGRGGNSDDRHERLHDDRNRRR